MYYTAMPQLISRIAHNNKETAELVRRILGAVLTSYPGQAMWPLAWLRNSKSSTRKKTVDQIFKFAELELKRVGKTAMYKLLIASDSLISWLQQIAERVVTDSGQTKWNCRPWIGTDVELADFVPPVQSALSVSNSTNALSQIKEAFPRQIPRMRTFSKKIELLSSKARPKKLKAYAVHPDTAYRSESSKRSDSSERDPADIGEFHFLIKKEAKGDLRKDARVQDLNNVINRLFLSSSERGTTFNQKRLRLRTFAVTCLSEETGMLEWVPKTNAMRNLISSTYNPQAPATSNRRRGSSATDVLSPLMKNNYEKKVQDLYFKNGNLKGAAALFDKLCLEPHPPVLYWWFIKSFRDPHSWYEARTRFAISSAVWSAVGHVIGLGDRHTENILVDVTSGECVHVDFDW